jgi:hypothetical protein
MKVFSAILSIYMFALLFVPCADIYAGNISTEINSVAESHSHDFDTCSPFCFCDCCQTVSQPAIYNSFSYFASLIGTTIPHIQASEYSIPVSFWRPPKI